MQGGLRHWLSAAVAACVLLPAAVLPAQTSSSRPARKTEAAATGPNDYRSQHFYIHTDLSPSEAKELLQRLEVMIKGMSTYWGKPPAGIIECYVVQDLSKWPEGSIDPAGLKSIEAGAGVTLSQKLSQGKQWVAKATVYGVADRGTPQHEAVHAYCGQTFGAVGPLWYAEGMAEMGNYWRQGELGVACQPEVVEYLKGSTPKSIHDIVNAQEITGDSWQNYAWRWALCNVLDQSPNYQVAFRQLGLAYLNEKDVTFEQVFGPVAPQIQFEYKFFLQHIEVGYRVDLCSWDWKKKSLPLRSTSTSSARIAAGKGWQPTSVQLVAGKQYQYTATGQWQTAKDGEKIGPDGASDGKGRLVGIVLKDFDLSEAFDLGASGTFTPPSAGRLFLRCQDGWGEIGDNKGTLVVKIKLAK